MLQRSWLVRVYAGIAILGITSVALAAERRPHAIKPAAVNPDDDTVELFAGVESGELDVRFIPRNSKEARILIENKTARPLNVQMPKAFAAVQVLAQRQGGLGGGGGGFGGGGGGGGAQGIGGGGGGGFGGGGGGGFGGGGGQFNVPAEKLAQIKVDCVCLEHGKPEPRANMTYRMMPIGEFTSDTRVHSLLENMHAEGYSQRDVQAAAWFLASGMSWQELADKKIERIGGFHYPYFNGDELRHAMELVSAANRREETSLADRDSAPADDDREASPSNEPQSSLEEETPPRRSR